MFFQRFFAALRFFTRIPVPASVSHDPEQLAYAVVYLPLIGGVVGAAGVLVTWLGFWLLPTSLAVVFGMAATLLLTGAFHEDGFADSCDGFGGGWDQQQILTIMKDSRLGSYGVIGMVLMLLAKWNALVELGDLIFVTLLAAHMLSRFAAVVLVATLDYVRADASKVQPLAQRPNSSGLVFAALCGLAPCVLLPWQQAAVGIVLVILVTVCARRYFVRRLGGYTGDCLGATQQLTELAFYTGVLCSFT